MSNDIKQPETIQELLTLAAQGLDHKVSRRTLVKLGAVALGGGLYMASSLKWAPPARAAGYKAGAVSGGGTISGVVGFAGEFPAPLTREVTGQPEVVDRDPRTWCALYGSPAGLQNVFVGIEAIGEGKPFEPRAYVVDQQDAYILPRFDIYHFSPDGQKADKIDVTVHNSDPYLHALKGKLDGRQLFNVATPNQGDKVTTTVKKPGFYELNCGPHPWERGWRMIPDNPYWAITDEHGRFKLTDVPPGKYAIVVLGEGIKPVKQSGIEVQGGKNTRLEIPLGQKHLDWA